MPEFLYFNLKNITATTKQPVQLALGNYIIKKNNQTSLPGFIANVYSFSTCIIMRGQR